MFFLHIHFQLARLKDDFMKHKEDQRTEQVVMFSQNLHPGNHKQC